MEFSVNSPILFVIVGIVILVILIVRKKRGA